MAKSCSKAITFFGIVQRIYVLFSSSTKRWNVLLEHVQDLTVKSLSNTFFGIVQRIYVLFSSSTKR
jgi:hypothetical protein